MSAANLLRAAIHAALSADPALTAALGGARVHDEPPAGAELPYVTLAEGRVNDWSTATEEGEEHLLTLHAWSRQGGHREAQAIAGMVREALEGMAPALAGHRLVNLRVTGTETRREAGGKTYRAAIRLRAVTEPN
ncbi:DUF3168 domain-containing protein [Ancylobacter sp. A5.8]|uniref:DUF3168 domain-containing protein n=1 Tax=Ancylobacter gelatini TaxID=2919920 RepID=UPI001F4E2AE5|nr:DUF3168 domain-containing protein [Ancylobacter gelatini]MCJ8143865.1 DUF3168 domain-containing protein [Ancylobacter gelatini]